VWVVKWAVSMGASTADSRVFEKAGRSADARDGLLVVHSVASKASRWVGDWVSH